MSVTLQFELRKLQKIKTIMDKLSYALGLSMGQNFKGSGIQNINADDFADALRAVYEDKEKKMSYDEAKKVVQDFFTELEANAGAMNEELGKKFLEQNAQQEGVKVTESGLQYLVLKEGNGVKPGPEDAVTVHYTGRLIDGTVFDSSVEIESSVLLAALLLPAPPLLQLTIAPSVRATISTENNFFIMSFKCVLEYCY